MRQSPEWYDRMYNNRALVPDFADHLKRWTEQSKTARKLLGGLTDISYGAGPNETLDIFPANAANAPVMVFLHGGYWRALDKSDQSFIAPSFTREGVCVVVPNYALCPAVSIPEIVMQMVKALAWVWRYIHEWGGDARRIHVVGHSAGGHLAAMLLACEWQRYADDLPADLVKSGLSVSGLSCVRRCCSRTCGLMMRRLCAAVRLGCRVRHMARFAVWWAGWRVMNLFVTID